MKKIIAICAIALMSIFSFASCGNMSMGIGTYTFNHVCMDSGTETRCVDVDKWYDYETGIEVKSKDGGRFWLSEGTYILVSEKDDCPFCND